MPPPPPRDDPPAGEAELLAHTILTALTVAKGRTQVGRRLAARPDGLDAAALDATFAEIDQAVTAAAAGVAALLARLRSAPAGEADPA